MTNANPWIIMLITIGCGAVISWNQISIMTSKDPAKLLCERKNKIRIFFDRLLLMIIVFSLFFTIFRSWNTPVLMSDLFWILCLVIALYTYWINHLLVKLFATLLKKDADSN
jgi:hypothetical protein